MTKLYQMTLEKQMRRLRRTAVLCPALGVLVAYKLQFYHHVWWASIVAIIAVQVAVGSWILMGDLRRDIREKLQNDAEAAAHAVPAE